jgi:hypothetical protein
MLIYENYKGKPVDFLELHIAIEQCMNCSGYAPILNGLSTVLSFDFTGEGCLRGMPGLGFSTLSSSSSNSIVLRESALQIMLVSHVLRWCTM